MENYCSPQYTLGVFCMPSFTVDRDFVKWAQAVKNVEASGISKENNPVDYWAAVKMEYKTLGGKFKGLKYE